MTAQDIVEKLKRYPVRSVCGAILLVCLADYYFRADMLGDLEVVLDTASRQAVQVDTNILSGATLEKDLEEMRTMVAELEPRIVKQLELAENQKYFYVLESETGVSLADLRQIAPPPPAKGAAATAFVGVSYNLTLSGTYAQAVAYFDELENGSRFYRLRNFNLQRGRDSASGAITLAISLELLGWP